MWIKEETARWKLFRIESSVANLSDMQTFKVTFDFHLCLATIKYFP